MNIKNIDALQIFDSRGFPTLEAQVMLENGTIGYGLVPSGASTGQFEALELRDGDPGRFNGKSVFQAIDHIKTIIGPALRGKDALDQKAIDQIMINLDGSPNKSRLGANAVLGVSLAVANAAARSQALPLYQYLGKGKGRLLPLPQIQIIGGGAHAAWRTDIQDFLIIAKGAETYQETLEMTFNVYHQAGTLLKKMGKQTGLADEGGYWPDFSNHDEIFTFLLEAIQKAGYIPGKDIAIALDIAASDLYDGEYYTLKLDQERYSSTEFAQLMINWCRRYPILSIEDPMADTDLSGWKIVADAIGDHVQLIGDDLFTTNTDRIQKGIDANLANAVLIKLNQVGTLTETLEAIELTQAAGRLPVISARSGETEDAFIAHLAVATNAGQLKVGSFARSERMVKWNEVLRIERQLGAEARFVGADIFNRRRQGLT